MQSLLQTIMQIENEYDDSAVSSERKEAEKAQKKKLREVRKLVADTEQGAEEKIKVMMSKCVTEIRENTKHQIEDVKATRQIQLLTAERDRVKQELKKSEALREKLQTLCRELQKQNKHVADESKRLAAEEQEKRQQQSEKFGATVKDISTRLDEHSAERQQLIDDNDDLRSKLKSLLEQFDLTQKHAEQQIHAKDLECQLADAKLKQEQQMSKALEEKASEFLQQIQLMRATETELRKQLESYGSKFGEFQEALTKSNQVFSQLKGDSDKQGKLVRSMDKKLRASEKEKSELRAKYDEVAAALIEKATEAEQFKRQKAALESLCRRLKESGGPPRLIEHVEEAEQSSVEE